MGCLAITFKIEKYNTLFSFGKFYIYFFLLKTIEVSNDLMNLEEITMPAFIDYKHNYRKLDKHCRSITFGSFVEMTFGTCI